MAAKRRLAKNGYKYQDNDGRSAGLNRQQKRQEMQVAHFARQWAFKRQIARKLKLALFNVKESLRQSSH